MSVKPNTLTGRRVIYTDYSYIDETNVVEVLGHSLIKHNINQGEIDYLYEYYKGNQPILARSKDIRPEINNRVVINRANEIVGFKVGYLMGEPIQYIGRTGSTETGDNVTKLNEYVFAEDKATKDKELAEWFTICGTAYRMIYPDASLGEDEDESPFEIYTLDPRYTFVVYHSGLGNKPLMAVKYVVPEVGSGSVFGNKTVFSVYTDRQYFEIVDNRIVKVENHVIGGIPIIEYPANNARLGAFEIVLPLLDSINEVASNRLDGIEQFIQSLMVLKGVDISAEDYIALKQLGGIKVPENGDVSYLTPELDQNNSQVLENSLYQTVLTICGMPNRNGGTSTSDTGSAVIMRDGWQTAEARAKDSELSFKRSEKQFLKLALNISNTLRNTQLRLSDIEIRFTRRNYENITEKTNVLVSLLNTEKVHPKLAFEHSGLFVDPDAAYLMSEQYAEEQEKKTLKALADMNHEHEDEPEDEFGEYDESSPFGEFLKRFMAIKGKQDGLQTDG